MKFAIFYTLKPETISAAMERPSDRAAIAHVSDSASAAAISLAVSSTGAFAHLETHELIPADQIQPLLDRAKTARAQYRPPGD